MRPRQPRKTAEPTIALINIVFLMLVFFMVAGTLAPSLDPGLQLVDTRDLEGREPANALVVTDTGALRYRGREVEGPAPYIADLDDARAARLLPDRNAPAHRVLAVARELRAAGAETVLIVTEKALQ